MKEDVRVILSKKADVSVITFITFDRLVYLANTIDLNPNYNNKQEKVSEIYISGVPDGLEEDCKEFAMKLSKIHSYKDDVNKFIKNNKYSI